MPVPPLASAADDLAQSDAFQILKADMDRAMNEMRATLARDLYRSEPQLFWRIAYPPTPWWQRVARRVQEYLWTLWRVLRGDDLDTPVDGDDW